MFESSNVCSDLGELDRDIKCRSAQPATRNISESHGLDMRAYDGHIVSSSDGLVSLG
jgi:hypothetical protein